MRRFRVLLSLLLGLSLMTQGMTVAVASVSPPMEADMSMSMDMEMSADTPCMDMDMSDQGMSEKCPTKCCDGKACADMSRCVQAQPAMTSYRLAMVYSRIAPQAPITEALVLAVGPPTTLLRPPISLHR